MKLSTQIITNAEFMNFLDEEDTILEISLYDNKLFVKVYDCVPLKYRNLLYQLINMYVKCCDDVVDSAALPRNIQVEQVYTSGLSNSELKKENERLQLMFQSKPTVTHEFI